jgi:hypothetical protein
LLQMCRKTCLDPAFFRITHKQENPLIAFSLFQRINTWILHESEAFIGKAPKGEVVVLYFEPLATQHMEASGSPFG